MILVRGPQSQRKSSSADAPVWKDRERKQCDLSSYFAALQPLCTAICGGKCARKWHFHGSWLCAFRPTSANDAFDPALWETFVSTTLGLEVPTLAALPRLHKAHNSPLAKCGCKKFYMDFHGDHTSTCTAHSGATTTHDWMVSVLGPLFRTAGHVVRTQHGLTASAGQRRCDVEIRNYLRTASQ
jgi:hypothetical protein